jgi:hypothetical protein
MQVISVLNRSSRIKAHKALQAAFDKWAKEIFIQDSHMSVLFNDELFSSCLPKDTDYVCGLGGALVVFHHFNKSFNALSKKALRFDGAVESQDQVFWSKLQKQIRSLLLKCLFGLEKDDDVVQMPNDVPFSNSVSVKFTIEGIELNVSFNTAFLKLIDAYQLTELTKHDLIDVATVPDKQLVSVKASFNSVIITLDEMLNLKVGHVVPLKHALQTPLVLETTDGALPLNAYLVKRNQNKAILIGK